jgi:hypothetical protein
MLWWLWCQVLTKSISRRLVLFPGTSADALSIHGLHLLSWHSRNEKKLKIHLSLLAKIGALPLFPSSQCTQEQHGESLKLTSLTSLKLQNVE